MKLYSVRDDVLFFVIKRNFFLPTFLSFLHYIQLSLIKTHLGKLFISQSHVHDLV